MIRLFCLTALAASLAACASSDEPDPVASAASPTPAVAPGRTLPAARDTVTLYKTASCGCCRLWGEHMEGEGFAVVSRDVDDLQAVKDSLGVPGPVGSCHTAVVDGYIVEGHVPAAQVRQLLRDRPDARGIAVPGMPLGSPGMEQGDRRDAYDVLLVGQDGATTVYEHIPGSAAP